MAPTPEQFTRALADSTRLRMVVLLSNRAELCVCDLNKTLQLPQPKISRHLAILRESEVFLDRRAGKWIHYRLHPDLPAWALDAVTAIAGGCIGKQPFEADRQRLCKETDHPASTCS